MDRVRGRGDDGLVVADRQGAHVGRGGGPGPARRLRRPSLSRDHRSAAGPRPGGCGPPVPALPLRGSAGVAHPPGRHVPPPGLHRGRPAGALPGARRLADDDRAPESPGPPGPPGPPAQEAEDPDPPGLRPSAAEGRKRHPRRPRRRRRRRHRWSTNRPTAASEWLGVDTHGLRARARARATPTSTTTPSGRRCRAGRDRAATGSASTPLDAEADEVGEPVRRGPVHPRARRRRRRGRPRAMASVCWRAGGAPTPRRHRPPADSAPPPAPKPDDARDVLEPARRARSCSPPDEEGSTRRPRRTTRAPTPGGPPSLWALTETRSAPSSSRSRGRCPGGGRRRRGPGRPWRRHTLDDLAPPAGSCRPRGWPLAVDEGGRTAAEQSRRAPARRRRDRCGRAVDRELAHRCQRASRRRARRSARPRRTATGLPGRARVAPHDGRVDRLGPARGEHDLAGPGAERARRPARGRPRPVPRTMRPSVWTRPGSAAGDGRPLRSGPRATSGRGGEVEAWSR